MIALLAAFAQLSIVAHLPDSAAVCEAVELSVAISASGMVTPQVVAPSLVPFDILRSSSVPHVTIDQRGAGSVLAEYRYVITTDHLGTFTIPSFEARVRDVVVRTRPLQIVVHPASMSGNVPTVVARARVDTSLDVNFRALALPETVFVGQQANYEVAVFLNAAVRDRLRRNPTFFPPDMQSMLAYDIPMHGDPPRRRVGSRCFEALVYQRALFPLMSGRFAIPPAQLVYSLPLSASFFSREETHELQTDSTIIVAVEPPVTGRPHDYGGAVGDLRLAAHLDTGSSRVGDPVLLTVRVSGTGNVKLFPRPDVAVPWATLVRGEERVDVDTAARKIGGSKEFDWVLTPRIAGELDLPPIRYSYFNPSSRRYEVAATPPAKLVVRPGTLATLDTGRADAVLALRPRYRGVPNTPVSQLPAFWLLLALVPVPAITQSLRARTRVPPRRPPAADRLRAIARMNKLTDACEVRRAFTMALADRLGLEPETFTRPGALARSLRRRGVSTEAALDAERFLRVLDEAAFSSKGTLPPDAADRAATLYRIADEEALSRIDLGLPAMVMVVALLAGAAIHAAQPNPARDAFDRGVVAYERHDFAAARAAFVRSVIAEPRAPDAWANLGTAAWAGSDTARSVAGWQRALRIEPLATDMRERVEIVHALPVAAAGYVPPVPAAWIFDVAAALWCLAWGTIAIQQFRRRAPARRELGALATLAGLFIIGGFVMTDRLDGRHVAVVRRTESLATEPTLGGERGPTAIAGEVVRTRGQQGAWTRVVLDDGRDGWLESSGLISLDVRDAGQIASR